MRAILLLSALILGSCQDVSAQHSLAAKACILKAATMLPAIPGLTITKGASSDEAVEPILRREADRIFGSVGARRFLDDFGGPDATTLDNVRRAFDRGEYDNGRRALVAFAREATSSGFRVELAVNAAGLSATYAFSCAAQKYGTISVFPLGLAK